MARRTGKSRLRLEEDGKVRVERTDEKSILQAMVDKIMANIMPDTLAFSCPNIFQASVQKKGGAYRTTSIEPNTDFALTSIKIGARDQVIFVFKPIEPNAEFEFVELDENKVFPIFEGFEQMVVKAMGFLPAPKIAGEHPYERAYEFSGAKREFELQERRSRREAEANKKLIAEAEKKAAEQKEADEYAENPMFGSW